MQVFHRDWMHAAGIRPNPSARPVLVIGMPRSGTSLVEQILASHPDVFGAGELTFWDAGFNMLKKSVQQGESCAEVLSALAEDYLRVLHGFSPDALRVVDKMPANFMFLGLIHAAFPHARIIHMRRNPIDTCLSIYFQHFDNALYYTNALEDIAHYYREYLRLMEHWRITLPENAILDVPYEGLVDDQEGWSRKILNFIGLPWNQNCVNFERNTRTVSTTSNWQVRQKIYHSSVQRWRHYEKFVGPLLAMLGSESI